MVLFLLPVEIQEGEVSPCDRTLLRPTLSSGEFPATPPLILLNIFLDTLVNRVLYFFNMNEELKRTFIEVLLFTKRWKEIGLTDDDLYKLQIILLIRNKAGMTQTVFAEYMGVSKKTVEVWECGRTHPTGPAFRLLDILSEGKETNFHL